MLTQFDRIEAYTYPGSRDDFSINISVGLHIVGLRLDIVISKSSSRA